MLNEKLRERLRKISVASISDALERIGYSNYMVFDIKPIIPGTKIVGPAVTIKDVPTSKHEVPLLALKALDMAERGDVIVRVVEKTDARNIALWGGLMTLASKVKGLEGAVLDGGTRDVREIRDYGFPVFARSIIPCTSVGKTRVEAINVPVVCGGVLVRPGDIIVGDDDGVVSIPKEVVKEVVEEAERIEETERKEAEEIRKGVSLYEIVRRTLRI
ncbi:MAG: RraA family protein [Thermoprotei archaeon]|mgnify:CR=1 FL=1|nr:MAG: RraA family protein [Thermoprotei archaeon]RLF01796.1 MAG: RraA family protein [Thermoprotei archaeon]